jgi:glycosyltransferase involved in cell wall biosynthesis
MGLIPDRIKSIENLKILFIYPDKRAVFLAEHLRQNFSKIQFLHVKIDLKNFFFIKNLFMSFINIISIERIKILSKIDTKFLYINTIRRPSYIRKLSSAVSACINSMNPKPDLILQWQAIFSPYVKKSNVPFALIIDNYADPPDSPNQKDELRAWSTIYKLNFYKLQKELYTNALCIFTLSKWCKEGLCREYGIDPQKVFAIGWGAAKKVEVNKFFKKDEKTILAIGTDYKAKGLDVLLEIANYLKEYKITIIGRDPKFRNSTPPKNVHILDRVSDEELTKLYSKSELFYIFSQFEPSAHVLWEAQGYGCVVIGYDSFGISEAVVDNVTGILLKTRDPILIAKKIRELYGERLGLKQMQKAAIRNYQLNGRWVNVSDKITQILKIFATPRVRK